MGQLVGLYEVIEPYSAPGHRQAYLACAIGSGDVRLMFIQTREGRRSRIEVLSRILRIYDVGYSYGLAFFAAELPVRRTREAKGAHS